MVLKARPYILLEDLKVIKGLLGLFGSHIMCSSTVAFKGHLEPLEARLQGDLLLGGASSCLNGPRLGPGQPDGTSTAAHRDPAWRAHRGGGGGGVERYLVAGGKDL